MYISHTHSHAVFTSSLKMEAYVSLELIIRPEEHIQSKFCSTHSITLNIPPYLGTSGTKYLITLPSM